MSQQHDHSWERFQGYISDAKARVGDRFVPIGLICLQADAVEGTEHDLEAYPMKDAMIIWPAEVPIDERGPLLLRLVEPYLSGRVLRGSQLNDPQQGGAAS